MRPSFLLEAAPSPEALVDSLRDRLDGNRYAVTGTVSRRNALLYMPESQRRFWSPCLDLAIEDLGEAASDGAGVSLSVVRGTFSPRPEIWTGFVFAVGSLAAFATLSSLFGIAQLLVGATPWGLICPLVSIVLCALLYFAAIFGQSLSLGDMYQLRAYLDDCIESAS